MLNNEQPKSNQGYFAGPKTSGVYGIYNTITKKWYVGSGADLYTRWHVHKHHLCSRTHHSKHLQSSWLKYGGGRFAFYILERCSPEDCVELEQSWIDALDSANPECGYNILPKAGSCLGIKRSEETKAKMREAAKKRGCTHLTIYAKSPEGRLRSSKINKGKKVSSETRAKISASVKAKVPEYVDKMKAALTGRKLSKEHKGNIALGLLGRSKTR